MKKNKHLLIGFGIVSVILILCVFAYAQTTWLQNLNAAHDKTNGRLRVKFEAYDSTANTDDDTIDQIMGNIYDSTTKAVTVSTVGDLAFTGDMTVTGDTSLDGALTVNDSSADKDTVIESNGNPAAFFVDAGNDRVGIFTAAPTVPFDVTGNSEFVGTMDVTGAVSNTGAITNDGGNVIFNNLSGDYDFTVRGDSGTLLALDAGNAMVTVNDVTIDGWAIYAPIIVNADTYTISSTSKAALYISEWSDTGTSEMYLPDAPADGTRIWIKDGDLNANTNNIVIGTEGSDTIDEGATYTYDADGEAAEFLYSATNTDWNIISGYAE